MTSPVRAPRPTPRRAPAPAPARRDHLRVVRSEPAPRRRPTRGLTPAVLAVSVLVVFGSLMAASIFHGLLVGGQAHLNEVEAEIEAKEAKLAREDLELAELQAPASILARAEQLGMEPADEQTWISPGSDADPVVTGQEPVDVDADGDGVPDDPDAPATSELAGATDGTVAE